MDCDIAMCFNKEIGNEKHFVTKTDITCYKVLFRGIVWGRYYAPYQGNLYRRGNVYKQYPPADIKMLDSCEKLGQGVYHSFHDYDSVKRFFCRVLFDCISQGISQTPVICNCTIPAGTICWANATEYASTAIIISEEVVQGYDDK